MPLHIESARLNGLPTEMRRALRAARETRGWSQAELGRQVGLPQVHISRIEAGKTAPRINTLLDLVRALDYDLLLVPRPLTAAARAMVQDYLSPDAGDADRPLYADEEDDSLDDEAADAD